MNQQKIKIGQRNTLKEIRKIGDSKGILFTKVECDAWELNIGDQLDISDAIIIKTNKKEK